MANLKAQLAESTTKIEALEEERSQIYRDSHVDDREHPRLLEINHELEHLWDLKRRLEAAISAGFDDLPVPPPEHPEDQIG
jgi:predicted RNase H-like nuclease (RuvC/YqgF family)